MAGKKGDAAREAVRDKIIAAFGDDYVALIDKKIYVQARDGENGEMLQFAITMTMPKTPVEKTAGPTGEPGSPQVTAAPTPTELSPADAAKVQELMKRLNVPIKS